MAHVNKKKGALVIVRKMKNKITLRYCFQQADWQKP